MFLSYDDYPNEISVVDAYPGTVKRFRVEGGWQIFNTAAEFDAWCNEE